MSVHNATFYSFARLLLSALYCRKFGSCPGGGGGGGGRGEELELTVMVIVHYFVQVLGGGCPPPNYGPVIHAYMHC